MDKLKSDLKQTIRMLRGNPGFAITAILALALGIGANTAIFSVVYAVLLKPLPFPNADRIVLLMNVTPQGTAAGASVPKFNVWRAQTQVLEDVTAYDTGGPGINLSGGDRPEQVKGIHVSHDFFSLFGAPMAIGRTFTPEEDLPRAGRVVIISNGLWQRRFASDSSVIGRSISLGGEPHTVIGVIASGFSFDPSPDLYLPFQADPNSVQHAHYFRVAARLKQGVALGSANAALAVAAEEFRRKFPNGLPPRASFGVEPMQNIVVRNVRTALNILLGAVGFVLLIACANVANLQLARAAVRSREIAIRAAIGAGRGRIVRQLLTESVTLSFIGGILGFGLGVVGLRGLLAVNPGNIPRIGPNGSAITLDWHVFTFAMLLSIVTGIVFGLIPALYASRADLNVILKESSSRGGSGFRQNKARSVLVVVEMALAIVLLIGAGLLIRTFAALHHVTPGFDVRNVLTLQVAMTGTKFDRTASVSDLARQTQERMEAIPGVEAVAASSYLPLDSGLGLGFTIEGRPEGQNNGGAGWAYVTSRFFEVFNIPIVRGRVFTDRDSAGAQGVVVINEAFAKQYWPNADPIGQRITIGAGMGAAFVEPPREIVGIVADARDGGLNSTPQPEMFTPVAQVRDGVMALNNRFMPMNWVARTAVPPFSVAPQFQKVFQDIADLPAWNVRSMEQIVVQSTARDQFNTLLLGIFAFVAILLASIGLYGLMSYSVEQRTMEFGIRLALGASTSGLRNMVVVQAMALAAAGVVIGIGAAFGLTRLMATMLFEVKPTDPLVFTSVAILLSAVALLAAYIPARRAVKVDPLTALRYQ